MGRPLRILATLPLILLGHSAYSLQQQPGAKPENYLYDLPYPAGKSLPILGGWGAQPTHTGDFYYSWDFAGSPGTIICACRDGVVQSLFDSRSDKRGVGVMIMHNDNTGALYGHMMRGPGAVLVRVGEPVLKGEPIAKIGPEAGGAPPHLHLHFTTRENLMTKMSASIEAYFRGRDGKPYNPKQGESPVSDNKEHPYLAEHRKLRRVRPLLTAALQLGAYDLAMECRKVVESVPRTLERDPAFADLFKQYSDLDKIQTLDQEILKQIESSAPETAYPRALYASHECKTSKLASKFGKMVKELKEKAGEAANSAQAILSLRRTLIEGLRTELRGDFDGARSRYEKVKDQKTDESLARIAKPLYDAITPTVR